MKKLTNSLSILLAILLLAASQVAAALEIEITPSGQIIFYQGLVLGDDNESESDDDEDRKEDETKNEAEDEDKDDDDDDKNESRTIIKTVAPQERKELKIRTREDKVEIELRQRNRETESKSKFEYKEELMDDSLELAFPAEDESEDDDLDESESDEFDEYREKVLKERRDRDEELVELSSEFEDGETKIKIESRGAQARLVRGATFNLDPETNRVTITTPSGNEHVLYHLPDQVILRMQQAGRLSLSEEFEEKEVEIEVDDDGGLVHVVEDTQEVRFLGIIPRSVPVEVELDDDTGEVTTTFSEDRTVIQQLLDAMSF